jgi:hypothetical protein
MVLAAPVGAGTAQADNTSIVSPGIAGGFVAVKFEPPIEDHPDNIGGYDFIVFGNSIWPGGDPASAWQEPGTIWVMKDENGNDSPDDTWYLIPGSHLSGADTAETKSYIDTDYSADWWPTGESSTMNLPLAGYPDIFNLPDPLYNTGGTEVLTWGYADVTPTMILGDLTGADGSEGDNTIEDAEDYPGINPVFFYTTPDTHGDRKIDPGSGGGDAVDIAWAVDPADISAGGVGLDEVTWIMIVSATEKTGSVGEFSCEIDGVTRVRRNN